MAKRVARFDSADRVLREDESLFREDFMQKTKGTVLFSGGARVGAFLHDSAHVTASGVFPYSDGKGGIRMEYRPKEEVTSELFLDSLQGVPMTLLHPKNTKTAPGSIIGSVKSRGIVEDNGPEAEVGVRSEVVVYQADAITGTEVRGLSLGFTCDLIMEPGLTPNGVKYDAIQRNLRADHLAVVPNPRVKTARLNLDDDDNEGRPKMPTVRLDSGIEYEAAAEVIHELTTIKGKLTGEAARADAAEAKADTALAEVQKLKTENEQIKKDAEDAAFARAKARLNLESVAASHNVAVKADASDTDIMAAVVKAVRGDSFDLTGKADAYIQAAFDLAVKDAGDTSNGARRTMLKGDSQDAKPDARNDADDKAPSAAKSQAAMLEGLAR